LILRAIGRSYARIRRVSQERKPLDATAAAAMLVLTALWGLQQVAVKVAAADVSLVMQAGVRSVVATALLVAWAFLTREKLFGRDGTLAAGLAAGALFAAEFIFIYAGLAHTHASRMSVFIYLSVPLTALGLHFLVRSERMGSAQWAGVAAAFAGIVLAFWDGLAAGKGTWLGDAFGILGAILWAATTVLIRATRLAQASATKTLFYQIGFSALALPLASVLMQEPGIVRLSATAVASLAYQGAIVAFASYLTWFWLLTRYLATRLAVLSFLTPLFGVLAGVAFLSEPLGPRFALAALLVGAGIVLVNLRR
jgi:drug/metabolite transporter (DMT)-like permease